MKKIADYRKLLGVTKTTELKEIKAIYRNFMKECHPDKFVNDEQGKIAAEEKSKAIIEAYHVLVSIAPETMEANKEAYTQTVSNSGIADFQYKGTTLEIVFIDGSSYEYFEVPKTTYQKFLNADTKTRFARRHIYSSFVYRKATRAVEV
jgi:DnaJ-class molecular chaperone